MSVVTILLVEDNDIDAKKVHTLLRYTSHSTCTLVRARSFADALTLLGEHSVDVILLDLGLPDSEGLHSVQTLLRQYPDTPLIVLTGYDDHATGIESIRAGAQEYIQKDTIAAQQLERSILFAIERKRTTTATEKFYRDGASIVPGALEIVEAVEASRTWETTVSQLRDLIAGHAPGLLTDVDQILMREAPRQTRLPTPTTGLRAKDTPAAKAAKATVSRVTAASHAAPLSPNSDPRGIIADVLSRYKKS